MAQSHVTVIGAGIVGISAALHLQREGFRVTVVDRQPPGEATSFGNACVITDSSVIPVSTPGIVGSGVKMLLDPDGPLFIRGHYALKIMPWLYRFVRAGKAERVLSISKTLADLLRDALKEHHELADNTPAAKWITDTPTVFLYRDRAAFEAEAFAWNIRRDNGIAFDTVDAAALRVLEPAVAPVYEFGAVMRGHGQAFNPSTLVKAHGDWLQSRGGELLQREVRAIEMQQGKPARLLTDQGPLDIDKLLIAAGPWSAKLCVGLGHKVPLESEGGYHVTFSEPAIELRHSLMSTAEKIAITPMEKGIRIGGLVELGGLDPSPVTGRSDLLAKSLRKILPEAQTERFTEWRGNRPSLPDSLPVIGRSPRHDNVFFAFGNQHVGLSSGPKTGKLITQLIAGKPTDIDLAPFRIDRF